MTEHSPECTPPSEPSAKVAPISFRNAASGEKDTRIFSIGECYILNAITLFLIDRADTDFQRGYLAALVNVATEGFALANEPEVRAAKAMGGA